MDRSARTFSALWLVIVAAALCAHLGGYPLYDADEGRNGEVGREMAATNDYVLPHLDGLPYLDKPIVYFAAEAAAMEVLGPTALAARLPALLFTFATAALLFWFAKRTMGEEDGWAAATIFLAMPLTLAFSRTVIFDSALAFFMTAAIMAFYVACHPERSEGPGGVGGRDDAAAPRPSRPLATLGATEVAWAAIAFGVLTKGPVAIAVPLLVAIPYAIKRKAFRKLWSWTGLLLFIAIIAPWVWAVQRAVPDFLQYVLVTETAQRLATKALKRTGPPWYFIPYIVGGAFPWIVALIASVERRPLRPPESRAPEAGAPPPKLYLWLWLLVPFVFFSISQSKRPQYILPLMPAIALLVASKRNGLRVAAIVVVILGLALAIAGPLAHFHMKPDTLVPPARIAAIGIGIAGVIGGLVALFVKRRELTIAALTLPVLAIPIAAQPLLVALGGQRSAAGFVAQLSPYVKDGTEVVSVEAFTGSLAFYLRKPIVVVTPDAEEFTSNYLIRHYAQFANRSAMRTPDALATMLAQRGANRIIILRNNDAARRTLVEQHGLRLVAAGPHQVAYVQSP